MEELRNRLIELINNCGLSIDCIYYIVKDVYRELSDEYRLVLQKQQEQALQANSEASENKNLEEEEK